VDAPDYLPYDAHGNDVSKSDLQINTAHTVTQRVGQVGVGVDGQRIVYTEGDNNGYTDQYGTTEANFIGTVIWHAPGIGGFLSVWFHTGLFITLISAVVIGAMLAVQKTHLRM